MCAVRGQPSETVNMRSSSAKGTPAPTNKKEGLTDERKYISTVVL